MQQVCSDHFSGDINTPCAWPDCVNGVADDQFVRRTSTGTVQLLRVRLDAYHGEPRYFWRVIGAGWWSIANILQLREVGLIQRRLLSDRRAYHYTTATAFKLIIETQELWLSDYRFLNDASEIRHGLALAEEVFGMMCSTLQSDSRCLFIDLLAPPANDQPRLYVACFSLERDNLTQWKGYGERTLGISFGIDPLAFAAATGTVQTSRFAPVIYADADKRHLLRSFIHDWSSLRNLVVEDGAHTLSAYDKVTRLNFFELLAMLKDYSFRDEREFRMIYLEHARLFADVPIDLAATRYRSSGPLIIPFTTTRDLAALRHAQPKLGSRIMITDVVVGPHPLKDLAVSGVREFLTAHGYDDIAVEPSGVPFR